jgi:integrase
MIALLALCPIRLRNFAELRIGRQIRRIGDTWWIILEAAETKSGRPDERPVPDILTAYIDRWLERWHPLFLEPGDGRPPRVARSLTPMLGRSSPRRRSESLAPPSAHTSFGIAQSTPWQPSLATGWESRQHFSSHTDEQITEKHYNKGASLNAVRRYQHILDQLTDD